MDRKLSDEQLDRLAQTLLRDFAPAPDELDEIAESPRLWWNVRSRIEEEKARRAPKRRFAGLRLPAMAFGALAVLIGGALAGLFFISQTDQRVAQNSVQNQREEIAKTPEEKETRAPQADPEIPAAPPKAISPKSALKNTAPPTRPRAGIQTVASRSRQTASAPQISPRAAAVEETKQETKTDFIALSYAGATDSGQILRVRVPSSMMVSLGVKSNVENESALVSAEVVVGDDGLARAIRFIR